MDHIYIKQKIRPMEKHASQRPSLRPPNQDQPSSKPFIFALLLIFVIIGIFLYKNEIKKEKLEAEQARLSADQNQPTKLLEVPLITPADVAKIFKDPKYQLIDLRNQISFAQKHIESSINLPLTPENLSTSLSLLDKNRKIILIDSIANAQAGRTVADLLIKQGYEVKYLDGGFETYLLQNYPTISYGDPESLADKSKAKQITAVQLAERAKKGEQFVFLDVRPKAAFQTTHIEGSKNIPLEELEQRKKEVPISGRLIVCDDDPVRSFQASVRLYDMGFWGISYLSDSLRTLQEISAK